MGLFDDMPSWDEVMGDYEDPPRDVPDGWVDRRNATIPDLVNVLFPDGDAFVWFMIDPEGFAYDMEIVEVEDLVTIGEFNPLLGEEVSSVGLASMIDSCWSLRTEYEHGYDFKNEWLVWALENGVAPGQPFLMRFGAPEYRECGNYYEREVDVEYEAELVRALPMSHAESGERWARAFDQLRMSRMNSIAKSKRIKKERLRHVDGMYVAFTSFWTGFYDGPPNAVRASLCSTYVEPGDHLDHVGSQLLYAEDNDHNSERALSRLIERVREKLPHITESAIRKMKRKWR